MTEQQHGDPTDPKNAPVAGAPDSGTPDDRYPGGEAPVKGDQEEPDVKPFAGDDDILSGHGPGAVE